MPSYSPQPWYARILHKQGYQFPGSPSQWFLRLHHPLGVEVGDTWRGKARFLEYLTRVLTQQRGRSALHHLGVTESHIVPGHPHPPYDGMLVHGDHVIGRGVWVVEKDLAVSLDGWCTRDACLLQARRTFGQAQDGKALGKGLGQRCLCWVAPWRRLGMLMA